MKIKLIQSSIGKTPKIKKTLRALNLTKMGKVVQVKDQPSVRGMVNRVRHLVEFIED